VAARAAVGVLAVFAAVLVVVVVRGAGDGADAAVVVGNEAIADVADVADVVDGDVVDGDVVDATVGDDVVAGGDGVEDDVGDGDKKAPPRASRRLSAAAVARLSSSMQRRGLRRGDVAAVDSAIDDVRRHSSGSLDGLNSATKNAEAAIAAVVVDRAFVSAKLNRFNRVYAGIKSDAVRARVSPVSAEVVQYVAAGDWVAANRRLNDAFALVSKR